MSFDLSSSLRRLKPGRKIEPLHRRRDDALPFVKAPVEAGTPILVDTTVYVDALQKRLPEAVAQVLRIRQINHSAVAVAELAHAFGRLDPSHIDTASALASVGELIDAIPHHRLHAPSIQATIEAGILTGTIARLRGIARTHRQALFNDAVLLLQAFEQGCCLLSRNVVDMDFALQLVPSARVLLYRCDP